MSVYRLDGRIESRITGIEFGVNVIGDLFALHCPIDSLTGSYLENLVDGLTQLRLRESSLEQRCYLSTDDGENRRNRLHLERCSDLLLGIDVDLGKNPPSCVLGSKLFQQR